MADEERDLGFKVEDKRRFTPDGEPREGLGEEAEEGRDDSSAPAEDQSPPQSEAAEASQESASARERAGTQRELPGELTFSSFIVGLASQAFMFLGLAPDPQSGVIRQDLGQAKAMIDILAMLQRKTAGNLDEDEARMMEEMLYELRLQYVKAIKAMGTPTQEESR
ncbi:MAG: DUF1844 domain-containing protein [Candidatus Dadabacteria bacterium]|nr:MAG: DUF1844 domain-containing protein [Candidatus Dadabacteria bacterium]